MDVPNQMYLRVGGGGRLHRLNVHLKNLPTDLTALLNHPLFLLVISLAVSRLTIGILDEIPKLYKSYILF